MMEEIKLGHVMESHCRVSSRRSRWPTVIKPTERHHEQMAFDLRPQA